MDKDTSDFTSKIHKFLDDNIRFIQYPTYAVGVIGLGMIAKSLYMFSKFTCAKSIPQEFLRKSVCLRGRVLKITLSEIPTSPSASNFHHVKFKLEHIPIANLTLNKNPTKSIMDNALNVELAGIQVNIEGMLEIQKLIPQESVVWFKLYGTDADHNIVYASIILNSNWKKFWRYQDLAIILLRKKQAMVGPLKHETSVTFNSVYSNYYRHLLFCEAQARQKKKFAWIRCFWLKDSSLKQKAS